MKSKSEAHQRAKLRILNMNKPPYDISFLVAVIMIESSFQMISSQLNYFASSADWLILQYLLYIFSFLVAISCYISLIIIPPLICSRLADNKKNPLCILLLAIPYIALPIIIILCFLGSERSINHFGYSSLYPDEK